ncbi:MAG: isocitrate/isopropylmalate dehydrogenase family protein [Anaerolineaceae bacterium]|nr:isocitrate/isopropylmalate dehydrogenase family protein [Anaerolineaceae bacterium]
MRKLCVIPGDGIGQEVIPAAAQVLEKVMPDIQFINAQAGWSCFQQHGDSVPRETLEIIEETGAALFGAVSSPSYKVDGYQSAILKMRKAFNLYANIRPVNSIFSDQTKQNVDMIIVRENTEGLYIREESIENGIAVAKRIISERGSTRIGQKAIDLCQDLNRERLTIIHKANVLPVTDGLFLNTITELFKGNPASEQLVLKTTLVDAAALEIIQKPENFDVIVTTNMFGDILSDLASYWCGGLGVAPSINLGDFAAIAEPVHGSAPDIAGLNIANPIAAILSAALLLKFHWQEISAAESIENAVQSVIHKSPMLSNGKLQKGFSTSDITKEIINNLY